MAPIWILSHSDNFRLDSSFVDFSSKTKMDSFDFHPEKEKKKVSYERLNCK